MRVLFVTCKNDVDYLSTMLWDGLQEVLGEENVVDAVNSPWLHRSSLDKLCEGKPEQPGMRASEAVIRGISGSREGYLLGDDGPNHHLGSIGKFDLLVINACFIRDHTWESAASFLDLLTPTGKVAYVEGWDAAWQVDPTPPIHIDAYFRKEIKPGVAYPMQPHYCTFAAPSRWFKSDDGNRPIDLFWSGNPDACLPGQEVRRPMLAEIFKTRKTHRSCIATCGLGYDYYFKMLRLSKFALCPSGADLTDALRTMEAAACGAIPIFVGYPDHIRDPWFPGTTCVSCTVNTLADHIDEALSHDSAPKRAALLAHAYEHHTTAARARQMLAALGVTP